MKMRGEQNALVTRERGHERRAQEHDAVAIEIGERLVEQHDVLGLKIDARERRALALSGGQPLEQLPLTEARSVPLMMIEFGGPEEAVAQAENRTVPQDGSEGEDGGTDERGESGVTLLRSGSAKRFPALR